MDANAQLPMAWKPELLAPFVSFRDQHSLESISHSGLFPCGEGAGYAGGITSAGFSGWRKKVADKILKN